MAVVAFLVQLLSPVGIPPVLAQVPPPPDPGLLTRVTGDPVTNEPRADKDSANANVSGAVSGDGRWVAFDSLATNLFLAPPGAAPVLTLSNVYVYDRFTKKTFRITPEPPADCTDCPGSTAPSISDDGHTIVYQSAQNIDPALHVSATDVFVQSVDLAVVPPVIGTPRIVSRCSVAMALSACTSTPTAVGGNSPSLSGDGHFVAFVTAFDYGFPAAGCTCDDDVFLADVQSPDAKPRLVSQSRTSASTPVQDNGDSRQPSVSRTGRFVAFSSKATDLVDTGENLTGQVYRRDVDLDAGPDTVAPNSATTRVSPDIDGRASDQPSISADGSRVAYAVAEPVVVADPSSVDFGMVDRAFPPSAPMVVYVTNVGGGVVTISGSDLSSPEFKINDDCVGAQLGPGQNCAIEVFVQPVSDGPKSATITIHHTAAPAATTTIVTLSMNVFTSVARPAPAPAPRLAVPAGPQPRSAGLPERNGATDVYVTDVPADTYTVASIRPVDPCPQPEKCLRPAIDPAISGDGATVVWTSYSNDFVPKTSDSEDVYLRDLLAPTSLVERISVRADGGPGATSGDSERPALSNDGALVGFDSTAELILGAPGPVARPGPGPVARPASSPATLGPPAPQVTTTTRSAARPANLAGTIRDIYLRQRLPGIAVAAPQGADYGTVEKGQQSPAKTFTFTNTGPGPFMAPSAGGTATGDYSVTGGTCAGRLLRRGDSCTVTAVFAPTTTGARPGSIDLVGTTASQPSTASIPVTGIGGTIAFSVTPATVNFGDVPPNVTSGVQTVTVTSGSSNPQVVNGLEISQSANEFVIQSTTCGLVPPGGSCTISLTFTPNGTGPRSATLFGTFGGEPFSVPLSGTGDFGAAKLSLNPSTLNFGAWAVGATSTPLAFTLKNESASDSYAVGPLSISGVNASDYTIVTNGCAGATLNPGQSCVVTVVFKPGAIGNRNAQLNGTLGPNNTAFVVGLTGVGTTPLTAVLDVSPKPLTWGEVPVGVSSVIKSLTVKNSGTGPVTITSVAVTTGSPEYLIIGNGCTNAVLAPNASCQIDLVFTPSAVGDRAGELTIQSNAGTTKAALGGKGVALTIKVDPNPVDFGSVGVGEEAPEKIVTITVPGVAVTPNGTFPISGPNASDFKVNSRECSSALPEGAKCTVKLGFKPADVGERTATLSGTFGASLTPFTVALKGAGGVPVPTITPNPVDFGSVLLGAVSGEVTVTVANTGDGKLMPGVAAIGGDHAADFTFVADNCNGKTLLKGQSCTVVLRFSPASAGARAATLTIPGVGDAGLKGTGGAPPPTAPPASPPTATTPPTAPPGSAPIPPTTPTTAPGATPPPGTAPAGTTTIRLSRPLGQPGEVITVEGSGFRPNTGVQLRWLMNPLDPQGRVIVLTTVTTDASGSFAAVPAVIFLNDPSGPRVMDANGGADQAASASFLVVPATMQRSDNVALNPSRTQLLYRR